MQDYINCSYLTNLEERLATEFSSINDKLNDIHNDVSAIKNHLESLHERVNRIEKHFAQSLPPAKPKKGFGPQGPFPPGNSFVPMVYYYPSPSPQ